MAAMDRVPTSQIVGVTALVSLGALGSWWTHRGPWAWLTELQLGVFGDTWSATLNVIGVLGLGLALGLVPLAVWHAHVKTQVGPRPDVGWMQTGGGRFAALGVVLLGIAAYQAGMGLMAGPLTDVPLAKLSSTSARYVRVHTNGTSEDLAIGWDGDWYAPVVDEDGRVVAVVAWSEVIDAMPAVEEGMRAPLGLPGPVLTIWRWGGLSIDTHVPVFELGATPMRAWFVGALLGLLGAGSLVGGWVSLRRARG